MISYYVPLCLEVLWFWHCLHLQQSKNIFNRGDQSSIRSFRQKLHAIETILMSTSKPEVKNPESLTYFFKSCFEFSLRLLPYLLPLLAVKLATEDLKTAIWSDNRATVPWKRSLSSSPTYGQCHHHYQIHEWCHHHHHLLCCVTNKKRVKTDKISVKSVPALKNLHQYIIMITAHLHVWVSSITPLTVSSLLPIPRTTVIIFTNSIMFIQGQWHHGHHFHLFHFQCPGHQ